MPKKKPLFSGGTYGRKASGRWGKLSGSEILQKMLDESFRPENMDKSQKAALKKAYEKTAKEINKKILDLQDYLQETGRRSESYDDIMESGGFLPETAPKSIDEMYVELLRGDLFEKSETPTPEKVEEFYNAFRKGYEADEDGEFIEGEFSDTPPEIDISKKWEYLRRLKAYNPAIVAAMGGDSETLDEIEKAMYAGEDMDAWIASEINEFDEDSTAFEEKYNRRKTVF